MDIFYALNILDFVTRILVVGSLFLVYLKLEKMDKDIIKSRIFLKYDELRSGLRGILFFSPLFLIASLLEHPYFRFGYGEEMVHLMQDVFLIIFQISVFYLMVLVYKILSPRH